MKKFLVLYTSLCALFVSACASIPNTSSSTVKYLQFRHPVNDVVYMQIILPNEKACQNTKGTMVFGIGNKYGEESIKSFLNNSSCSDAATSQSLPYQATLRDKVFDYLLDIEFSGPRVCTQILDEMKQQDGSKESFEILSSCAKK
ncbi:MAG: hypothetical protein Q8K00_03065 [Syntrophales bacterium]|nr:hypothetical protein [Syntrophales bacterium]